MKRLIYAVAAVSVLLLIFDVDLSKASASEQRVALVVGNGSYEYVPKLVNPSKDALLIAETLKALGFSLVGGTAQIDLDKQSFDNAVRSFGRQSQGADVALFYYAGHGLQVRGSNFLVPVNANPTREADLDFELEDVGLILRQMEASGTRLNLVFLDACRNNPFGGRGIRALENGLAQMRAPEGSIISFATQPGNIATDGQGGNSPFTGALARTIKQPGLGVFDALNEVGLSVKRATGGSQQPWFSSSPISGPFYFAGPPSASQIPPADRPQTAAPRLAMRPSVPLKPAPPPPPPPPPQSQSETACFGAEDCQEHPGYAPYGEPTNTGVVLPRSISPLYASEDASKGRLHTCVDQYNANKATNSNGGLLWVQQGGGYYSVCNQHLKRLLNSGAM